MVNLTEQEQFEAGKVQMYQYLDSQYLEWHLVAVESIKKMMLSADEFYQDMVGEKASLCFVESQQINNEIRLGWIYEALSHAEQSIEDLFSLLMLSKDISNFVKNVVRYSAAKIKKYIWDFKTNDPENVLKEFFLPYFDLDDNEAWMEHQDCFVAYREAVLRMQEYLKELVEFHKEYYQDYCQYKHGLAVGLKYGKWTEGEALTSAVLQTFENQPLKDNDEPPPALIFNVYPETQTYLRNLYEDKNLLRYSLHQLDIEKIIDVTEKAYEMISVLRHNLIKRSQLSDQDEFREWAFPSGKRGILMTMGFPVGEEDE